LAGGREEGLPWLSLLPVPFSVLPTQFLWLACPVSINGDLASGQECWSGWAPGVLCLQETVAWGSQRHIYIYIYIYIYASGNLIQPAPASVFRHPCPAQVGPVASALGPAHIWLRSGGMQGPEGKNMSGLGGAGPAPGPFSTLTLSFPVPGPILSAPDYSLVSLLSGKA
jgi:hypothetical protein